jgi:hypothetical protein
MQTIFSTAGDGYWSNVAKAVHVTDMQLAYINDERDFGELRVYFNTKFWDVNTDGLIYTDSAFIEDLRDFLITHDLSDDCDYSEQGMQGDNYVSLDVGEGFIKLWDAKFNLFA